ncbi:hypothetical protein PanWU01x14_212340 [Parasponia andersonii]|uniref:Uncharacterized protein n=1 Tax=Parasponia andersonii TaxID=3476 RepID=A0A2P5BT77_PARAD|nr:hypothetical protein PanWU01x14_212340 [Parasponia andersonii]
MAVVGLKGEHDLENGTTAQGQGMAPSLSITQVSRGNAQVKNDDTSYQEVEAVAVVEGVEEVVVDGDGVEEEEVVAGGNGVVGDSQKLAKEEEEKEKALTITITVQAGTECLAKMIISWESLHSV